MIVVSKDKSKLDIHFIHTFLSTTYWAKGRTLAQVEKTIENSICFGIYKDNTQIGFARVVTDYVVFAYLMDVFIVEEQQGKGYAKELMKAIIEDEKLTHCSWMLKTLDAHDLYKKFDFTALKYPTKTMERTK